MTVHQLYERSHLQPILLYDGVCNLCNGFVNHVIDVDKEGHIHFCALQEKGGLALRKHLDMGNDLNTAVGLWKGKTYTHSDVLYMVAKILGGWWRIVLPLYFLPKSFRDWIYNWVARNRYKWFGQRNDCMIPTVGIRERFICN